MKDKKKIVKKRIYLKDIESKDWEHPADKASLKALKKVKYLDKIIEFFMGTTTEKAIYLATLGSSIKVTETQFPKLHKLHIEACKILDMNEVPDLFVSQNPFLNAGAVGVKAPFVVLNSSVLDILKEDEILAIIGHELGHIKSGHVLYKTLLHLLIKVSTMAVNIPFGTIGIMGIIGALKEWDRKSELSCDRAGLLTCQDRDTAVRLLMKLTGGSHTSQMNTEAFIQQAETYKSTSSISDTAYKLLNSIFRSHPYPVVRLYELIKWVNSGAYEKLINKDYKKADTQEESSFFEDVKQAAEEYKDDISQITKPIEEFAEKLKFIWSKPSS